MRLDVIPSFALEPVATPGNDAFYGIEFDANLMWRGQDARTKVTDFLAGLQYGVFFSGGALNRPEALWPDDQAADAKVAQTLQAYLAVPFE
jgi:hypothetical protein